MESRPPATPKSIIVARIEARTAPADGDLIHFGVKDGSMLFFDAVSGDRILARS